MKTCVSIASACHGWLGVVFQEEETETEKSADSSKVPQVVSDRAKPQLLTPSCAAPSMPFHAAATCTSAEHPMVPAGVPGLEPLEALAKLGT